MKDRLKTLGWCGLSAAAEMGLGALGLGPLAKGAEVSTAYFVNLLSSEHEKADADVIRSRNHHLRRGMAGALKRSIAEARKQVPDLPEELFKHWAYMFGTEAALDLAIPAEFTETFWEASNTYRGTREEDLSALADLLQSHVPAAQSLGSENAEELARIVLPHFQREFAEAAVGNEDGFLLAAFQVKSLSRIEGKLDKALAKAPPIKMRAWSLPVPTGYFVGREDYLNDLHERLQRTRGALIWAQGGFGKSQTALEYVRLHGDKYDDVLWLSAAGSLTESYRAVAKQLGSTSDDDKEVLPLVRNWMAAQPGALVVFDNVDDPQQALAFWPTGQLPHILVTSRKSDLTPLPALEASELQEWKADEALAFLKKRTSRPQLNAAEEAAATKLAQETGYLPLALEQAGAFINHNSFRFAEYLPKYLHWLSELPLALQGGYTKSVAATWKLSVDRLGEGPRVLLDAIAHLAPNGNPFELLTNAPDLFGPELSRALAGGTPSLKLLLGDLREYSLVRVDLDEETFSLHKLLAHVIRIGQGKAVQSQWMSKWVDVFERFLPTTNLHLDSPPYTRAWETFQALYFRIDDGHTSILAMTMQAGNYDYHFGQRGRWRDSEALCFRVHDLLTRIQGAEHPNTLTSMNNLALLYTRQGRYAEAEPLYERALRDREKVLGLEHPDTLASVNNLSYLYLSQRRYAEAEPLCERALRDREKVLGQDHNDTLVSVNNLANLYFSQGKYAEVEPLFERALRDFEKVLGREHPNTLMLVNNLAGLYRRQGRYEGAEPLYQRALRDSEKVMGREHPNTLMSVNNLAGLYFSQGRYQEAEPLYERALCGAEKVLGPNHPTTKHFRHSFIRLRTKMKKRTP